MVEAIERSRKELAGLEALEQGMGRLDTENDGSSFQELRAREAEIKAEKKAAAEMKAWEVEETKRWKVEEDEDKNCLEGRHDW